MAVTRAQLVTRAKRIFEAGLSVSYIISSDWNDFANVAQAKVARDCLALRETATLTSVANQADYAWPARLFEPYQVWWDSHSKRLSECSEEQMYERFGDWQNGAAGTPERYVWNGIGKSSRLRLHPKPSSSDKAIHVAGYFVPADMTNDADVCEFSGWEHLVVWQMVIQACEVASDDPEALRKLAIFEQRYKDGYPDYRARSQWPDERDVVKGDKPWREVEVRPTGAVISA